MNEGVKRMRKKRSELGSEAKTRERNNMGIKTEVLIRGNENKRNG